MLKRMDFDRKCSDSLSQSALAIAKGNFLYGWITTSGCLVIFFFFCKTLYTALDNPRIDKNCSQKNLDESCSRRLQERGQSSSSEKYPELTVRTFFEFMRTAYQVNDSFDELASVLAANSEIDWTELAKIDLNLQASPGEDADICLSRKNSIANNRRDKSIGTSEEKFTGIVANSNAENDNRNRCSVSSEPEVSRSSNDAQSYTVRSQENPIDEFSSSLPDKDAQKNVSTPANSNKPSLVKVLYRELLRKLELHIL